MNELASNAGSVKCKWKSAARWNHRERDLLLLFGSIIRVKSNCTPCGLAVRRAFCYLCFCLATESNYRPALNLWIIKRQQSPWRTVQRLSLPRVCLSICLSLVCHPTREICLFTFVSCLCFGMPWPPFTLITSSSTLTAHVRRHR